MSQIRRYAEHEHGPGRCIVSPGASAQRVSVRIEVLSDENAVSDKGATLIAEWARNAIDRRGRFIIAVSGGNTPWLMLQILATKNIEWSKVDMVQADERLAPPDSPDRNLTALQANFVARVPPGSVRVYPMLVEETASGLAAAHYAETLAHLAGSPPVLDLVQLGLGPDGHTASLVPGDPVLEIDDTDVAVTGVYRGRRRMTLTYPILNRARNVLWLVTGGAKADVLARFSKDDMTLPACRVNRERAVVLADQAAASRMAREHQERT
jgi:6-phosphogluconolactonase